jgi:predicted membrane channel-forming protein YqfA (hemolysin III family)
MWMLSFIPDTWLYTAVLSILFGGMAVYVIGTACRFIPALVFYKAPLQAIGLLAIIAGVYFYGSYDTEKVWRQRVADLQVKLDQAATESQDVATLTGSIITSGQQAQQLQKAKLIGGANGAEAKK